MLLLSFPLTAIGLALGTGCLLFASDHPASNGGASGGMAALTGSGRSTQPRRAASMVATSIFFIGIIASKARLASAPPAASASVSARGVICHERPQRSLHQPHWLCWPPLPTIAFQ